MDFLRNGLVWMTSKVRSAGRTVSSRPARVGILAGLAIITVLRHTLKSDHRFPEFEDSGGWAERFSEKSEFSRLWLELACFGMF